MVGVTLLTLIFHFEKRKKKKRKKLPPQGPQHLEASLRVVSTHRGPSGGPVAFWFSQRHQTVYPET